MFRTISSNHSVSLVAWCIFLFYPSRQISCVRPPWCPLVCGVYLWLRCFNYSQFFVYKHFHRGKGAGVSCVARGEVPFSPSLAPVPVTYIWHMSYLSLSVFCGFSLTLTNTDPNTGFIRRASLMTCENEVMFTHPHITRTFYRIIHFYI